MGVRVFVRVLLGAALLLALIGVGYSQDKPQPAGNAERAQGEATEQQYGTEQSPFFVKVVPPAKTDAETTQEARDREEKEYADSWLIRWTGAVAIFTLVLGGIGSWQGIQLKRSVDVLTQAERAQMFIMIRSHQLGFIENAARTTDPKMQDGTISPLPTVWYRFKNYGKTPAIIREISAQLTYFERLPDDPVYVASDQVLHEQMIASGDTTALPGLEKPQVHSCPMTQQITVTQAKSIVRAQAYIWFYGRIIYDDTFGIEHEHRFLWRYGGAHGFRPNYEHPKYIKNT